MDALREIKNWFSTGTAEGDKSILGEAFVYIKEFEEILNPPPGSPYLLVGRKGSGKSAVLDFSQQIIEKHSVPVIKLIPSDIDTSNITEKSSTGDMTRFFFDALILSICRKLSEKSSGWFDGDFYTMYSAAVDSGERSPDLFGRIGKFFSEIAKGPTQIDINSAFPHLSKKTREEVSDAVRHSLRNEKIFILIDDTDQVSNPDKPGHLNRIWSLVLAARMLAEKTPQVKIVLSLRTEIWERLKRDQKGQRDQTDHFASLVVEMPGGIRHVEDIVRRRLELAGRAIGKYDEPYSIFFEGPSARAPGSNEFRSWEHLISVRSRGRPRDAIQMVNALSKRAIRAGKPLITEDELRSEMPGFSKAIVEQFAIETSAECQTSEEIIRSLTKNSFNDSGYSMSSEHALQHFEKLLTRFGISLYGVPLPQTRASAFQIWSFLYINGVLNARISDSRQKDGYRHLDPKDDITLVSNSRWNELQKIMWELNTAYRDYVSTIGDDDAASMGLASKRKARGSRRNRNVSHSRRFD